jgi:hypothetical protein
VRVVTVSPRPADELQLDALHLDTLRADAALLPASLLPRPRIGVRVIDLTEHELRIPATAAAAVKELPDYGA